MKGVKITVVDAMNKEVGDYKNGKMTQCLFPVRTLLVPLMLRYRNGQTYAK